MAQLYKLDEWQGNSGYWFCECTSIASPNIVKWVVPARLLNMDPADFLKWLIDEYKPDMVHYNKDCSFVCWGWENQTQMRKYKNMINRIAREKHFMI